MDFARIRTGAIFAVALLLCGSASAHEHIRQQVDIPMRDSPNTLAADVYLPASTGSWPVILIQTPYNKVRFAPVFQFELSDDPLLQSGEYAFVVVDWRGFFASADAAYAGSPSRGKDGYDTVQWVAAQAWCDGNVGTWGLSALGHIQMVTAAEQPPALKGCVPMVYHYGDRYEQYYPGGVYERSRNEFVSGTFGSTTLVRDNPQYNALWQFVENTTGDPAVIDVPMLHISGWYDHATETTIREMQNIQAGGGPNAAGAQKLLIGPWNHGAIGARVQGELEYPAAEHYSSEAALAFFDHYVRGIDNGWEDRPAVEYFRMNAGAWLQAGTWPPGGTVDTTFHLHADGTLGEAAPGSSGTLGYTADPADPVLTLFGAVIDADHGVQGPGNLSSIESRADVLTFTTPVLAEPLTVEGAGSARLYFECDAVDTDFAVRLTEVYPDGRSMLLVDGIRRASLRNTFETRELLSPGTVYEVEVALPPVSVTIPAGHHLRVLVAPSNFDRFDKNMQDGSDLSDETGAVATPANVTLHMSPSHPSALTLPVVPASADSDGDGMPDSFEQMIIDHDPADDIETLADVLPGDDYDGDGHSNLQEYLYGTDPTALTPPLPVAGVSVAALAAGLLVLAARRMR